MLRLGDLLEKTVPPLGFELVDWDISSRSRLLRVFIDAPKGVGVDDCARVSHHLTRLLAVENIEYDRLEVSSPGLDRSLGKLADYARFTGEEAQVHLRELTEGTRRLKGILRGTEGQNVLLETATGTRAIPFHTIDRCRLIPNIEWRKAQ